jgi:hypothetical protein
VGVGIVGQQAEVQADPPPLRADRHGADGRDPVAAVPTLEDRSPAPGARVRRTVGVSMKPDSSRKTR